jgi:hypothetical protein
MIRKYKKIINNLPSQHLFPLFFSLKTEQKKTCKSQILCTSTSKIKILKIIYKTKNFKYSYK